MGFLERAIRRGVSDAVGKAVGDAVTRAVEPKATELANRTANELDRAAADTAQGAQAAGAAQAAGTATQSASGLEGALGNLERSMNNYATEVAKNTKVCPSCGEAATADKKFCPTCGTKLPEQTLAQGCICPNCGRQNGIGTRFCQECGTKLPAAVAAEQAEADRDAAVLARWDTELTGYPVWSCGGSRYRIEPGEVATEFSVTYLTAAAARNAVEQYRSILRQNGFREAGEYPDREHLYKKINGICYHVDTEHCFEGDAETASIYFCNDEPTGGFDYVKPQPKKGLFGFFK